MAWLDIIKSAKHLDCCERTTWTLINTGDLRFSRLPDGSIRIKQEWLDDYLLAREDQSTVDRIVNEVLAEFI